MIGYSGRFFEVGWRVLLKIGDVFFVSESEKFVLMNLPMLGGFCMFLVVSGDKN
ncbi:hypothetical protein HT746_10595 [Burkholderia pyrrocinia]|uniref:hypothetical protein n=1 Tax=Burkholderia pyrrocinia TaxID=60550 RepID=UPI001575FE5F|nr:hypothetical protein [Burkholderia pyrrocinia]NTX27571.1 hypothetical protein [Burkholderia pyrrocinia]